MKMKLNTCLAAVVLLLNSAGAYAIECATYIKNTYAGYATATDGLIKANTWWTSSLDTLPHQSTPSVGSVLVFPGPSSAGHVAYVAEVVSASEIKVNHANWNRNTGAVDGSIWTGVRVQDVSGGNWTKVKIEFGDKGQLGSKVYPTYGFVSALSVDYNNQPVSTKCSKNATSVGNKSIASGKIELFWSKSCKTNWAKVTPKKNSFSTSATINLESNGTTFTSSGTGTILSPMVNAANQKACASGSITDAAGAVVSGSGVCK